MMVLQSRMWRYLCVLTVLSACDRVLGLERTCDEELFGSTCSTCGGVGQACCAGATTCGDGLFCGDGTCTECVLDAAPGRRHMCAVRYDGTVWCAGLNNQGQLARPVSPDRTVEPVQVMGATGQPLANVIAVGAGRDHTCALRANSTVVCWGSRQWGQFGDGGGMQEPVLVPVEVVDGSGVALANITKVLAGYTHSCALDRAGHIWCWGGNGRGQLGDGSLIPRPHASRVLKAAGGGVLADVVELGVGHLHNCGRTRANQVWCWGSNTDGELGNGAPVPPSTPDQHEPLAVQVRVDATSTLEGVTSIGVGSYFTCAAMLDGTARCWGAGWRDRLGNGEDELPTDQNFPINVLERPDGPPFRGAATVAVGSVGCIVTNDAAVWCWGKDQYGTTGGRGGSTVPAPVFLDGEIPLEGVDRIVAHYAHACAHVDSGRFVCWGRNTGGELANGTIAHTGVPATIDLTCP